MVDTLNLNLVPDDNEEEFIVDFGEVINVGGSGGTSDFNELTNRPKYDGQTMTGDTNIPKVPTQTSELENNSDFQTGTEVQTAIGTAVAGKQDTLTAGDNITITNNVISATTGPTYTAGNAITIENNAINADIYPADYFTAGGTVTGTGSSFTLDKTIPAKIKSIEFLGDTEQNGTPTPDNPVDVNFVDGNQTVTINGKNLWNMDGISASGNATVEESNGEYKITWTGGFDAALPTVGDLDANRTYTLSFKHKGAAINIKKVGASTSLFTAPQDTEYKTYTYTFTGETGLNLEIIRNGTTTNVSAFVKEFQVEAGSEATTYIEYQSADTRIVDVAPYHLCKIGDHQDYIYKSGDDWYVHKEIGEITLDGTTEGTWTYLSDAGHERFVVTVADIALQTPYAADTPPIQYCAYFEGSNGYHTYTGDLDNIISGHNNNHQIVIRATQFTSLEAFKTWLAANTPTVYYVLATPTNTQVTNGTSITNWNAMLGAKTTLGATNFTTTSDTGIPVILNIEAFRNSAEGVASYESQIPEVIDTLESTNTKNALSANMGRVLNESIGNVESMVYGAVSVRSIADNMEPTWPEEDPDGFRLIDFEPQYIYYSDAYSPVKIYYSDTDSVDDFMGYIQNEMVEDNPEDEPPTMTYGFKLVKMNGADNTPEIYVGQSLYDGNNELTSLSFEQVGAGGSGPTVVQTTGTSQTDVMSQDATTKLIYIPLLANQTAIKIGSGGIFNNTAFQAISIGNSSNIRAGESVLIGTSSSVTQNSGGAIVIGASAKSGNGANNYGSIALGWGAGDNITASGMMDIGSLNTSYGYNNTKYRLITGVYDGQGIHDAATVAQGNTLATSAPTTSTVGVLGQLYTDTTTMHTYQCTDITGGVYTWTQRW